MQRGLRPAITAGVALTGAGIIAVTPVAAPLPNVQHRSVQLTTVESGVIPFPLEDWNELVANTTANFNGLTEMFDHTTNIFTLPSAVYTDGLPQVFKDLSTDLQALAAYEAALVAQGGQFDPTATLPPLPNLFADPVLNPVSLLTLGGMSAFNLLYAPNAELVGLLGISANVQPALADIGNEVQAAFQGGSFTSAELSALQGDFTTIGNNLLLAPTTILNDYLNGYPVVGSAPDPILTNDPGATVSNAYTLNAPFTSSSNDLITPEYGLLTNPDALDTVATGAGNTVPLQTGTLASLLQIEQTLADELQTVTASVPGSGVSAPPTVDASPLEGPNTVTLGINIQNILNDVNFPDHISGSVSFGALGTLSACGSFFDDCSGNTIDVNLQLDPSPSFTVPIGTVSGPTVPAYTYDITQDDFALTGSVGPLAAPVTGTVDSSVFGGNLLAPDPVINLAADFDQFFATLFGNVLTVDANVPLSLTNSLAEILNTIFTI